MRKWLIKIVRMLIRLVVSYKHSNSGKFIESFMNLNEIPVYTGLHEFDNPIALHFINVQKMKCVELEDGKNLTAACDHIIIAVRSSIASQVTMSDLKVGDLVMVSGGGFSSIVSIEDSISQPCFDVTMSNNSSLYETSEIISHNTMVSAIFIAWYLIYNKEKTVLVISQSRDKVKELINTVYEVLCNLPLYAQVGVVRKAMFSILLDNGSRLVSDVPSPKGTAGAGYTINLLYCDEFALIDGKVLKKFWGSVYPTISSSSESKIIISSTPRGLNLFYTLYSDGINGRNSFHPMRVDYFDVDGREDHIKDPETGLSWKETQIMDLGVELFNQEFGLQFLAGSTLLFKSRQLKIMKKLSTIFIARDLSNIMPGWYEKAEKEEHKIESHKQQFGTVDTPAIMKWHPKFDVAKLADSKYQFSWSIDIADGDGGDYFVANLFQIVPMSYPEVDNLVVYGKFSDFFKLIQVGIYRTNKVDIPQNASFLYHLLSEAFATDRDVPSSSSSYWSSPNEDYDEDYGKILDVATNVTLSVEINKEGKYFINLLETLGGEDNMIDTEVLIVKTMHRADSVTPKMGLLMNAPSVAFAKKMLQTRVKNGQMVLSESSTIDELLSMAADDKGRMNSQTGHDDCYDTCRNESIYMETDYYSEQIEQMTPYLPHEFLAKIYTKLGMHGATAEDDDFSDMGDIMDAL